MQPKRSMTRIVRTPHGVLVDPTGKLSGRGAYLHNLRSCWLQALKGALAHSLKTTLTAEDRERLQAFMVTIEEDPSLPVPVEAREQS